ncbi:MAG: lamin tail domain-containing protein, partial [Caldilineaceae bacterium]|nr:lamin tail domain-containing protein [Caldilineaceae bacterium]
PITGLDGLATYLAETGADVQWLGDNNPKLPGLFGHTPPSAAPPDNLATWFSVWSDLSAPLLPVGNGSPDLPGALAIRPRYTGLAVAGKDYAAIWAALRARRGWITSKPGQWLTLHVATPDGLTHWMGSQVNAGNRLVAHVEYGDRSGESAALAIWQDGRPIRQLDLPPTNGAWTVDIPAVPGSILVAVATQADGNWAVTAPIMVQAGGRGTVLINEALPAPRNDLNHDGVVDSEDEFIELYNPGAEPVSLAGWQLSDAQGDATPTRRFTFGVGRFIAGGERLLLWRRETRISLDNDVDSLRLLDAGGEERDATSWDESLPRGRSMARVPDGQAWLKGAAATPGDTNRPAHPDDIFDNNLWPTPTPRPPGAVGTGRPSAIPTLEPSHGQAGGPPASVAQSKLAGLKSWVEFFAVVTAPPGLFNGTIYVADPAGDGATAGIGVNVYLRRGEFPPLVEGDQVRVRGRFDSFRGEMELVLDSAEQIWPITKTPPLQPLPVTVAGIGEALEGRLVTFSGAVSGWQGDSILLVDPAQPDIPAVRVTVRSSLPWKRPYVQKGQWWQVTGIVSQFALEHPWNGGYRVLVRYKSDLMQQ